VERVRQQRFGNTRTCSRRHRGGDPGEVRVFQAQVGRTDRRGLRRSEPKDELSSVAVLKRRDTVLLRLVCGEPKPRLSGCGGTEVASEFVGHLIGDGLAGTQISLDNRPKLVCKYQRLRGRHVCFCFYRHFDNQHPCRTAVPARLLKDRARLDQRRQRLVRDRLRERGEVTFRPREAHFDPPPIPDHLE